ncbi:MAG: J domain-containing protein [Actinobacteria bacterium]|nr:J domain-containing protein [Actinomycetota bacterium]
MATHYETLGVGVGATREEIRAAYRRLARIDHPDRWSGRDPAAAAAAARRMVALNEAWRVLGDPASRADYDARLRGDAPVRQAPRPTARPGAPPSAPRGRGPGTAGPLERSVVGTPGTVVLRGLPWIVVLVVLGAIFVVTAFAGGADDAPAAPTSTTIGARVGDCVRFPGPTFVDLVDCAAAHDGTITAFVPIGRPCPAGQANVYLPDRGESACIRPS